MPTAQKAQVIDQTREKYSRAAGVIFAEYRGLKVKEMQQLRSELGKKGGEIQVVKNTLFMRAAGEDATSIPVAMTSGPTAVTFVYENESEVAKTLFDYAKTKKALVIKGAFLGGKAFDEKQIEAISKLPPREVLIAQVIGAIAAPISNLVRVIEQLYATPIRTIGAVADKLAEGSPATAPAEAAAPESPAQAEEAIAPAADEPTAPTEEPAAEAGAETAEPDGSADETKE